LDSAIKCFSAGSAPGAKTPEDVAYLSELIHKYSSIEHARGAAREWASAAARHLDMIHGWLPPSIHRDFIGWLVDYVVERDK
jgi:geranylgeranyl pyrophosphate synthase